MRSLDELPWFVLARGSARRGWADLFGGVPGMLATTVLWATVSTAASPALQGSVEVVRQFPTWCWGQLDLASSQPWPASSRKWRCSLTEQAENGGVVEFLAPF